MEAKPGEIKVVKVKKEKEEKKEREPLKRIDQYQLYRASQLPGDGRVKAFLDCFDQVLEHELYKLPLKLFLETCAKCNNCAAQCHITYDDQSNINWLPAKRSDLIRKIFRKRHTLSGKILGKLVGAEDLTEEMIDEMYESFYRCTMCRRCALECPLGVDNSLIARVGRVCLSAAGMVPNNLKVSVESQLEGPTKNTSAIPEIAFIDTLEFLDEEIEEETGLPIKFPINKEGAEILYLAPVSDYIMEADTLMGCAMTFFAAEENWTVATGAASDAINYGLFYDDRWLKAIIEQLFEAIKKTGVKKLVMGECGHATKAQKVFSQYFGGDLPFEITTMFDMTAGYIREGKIKLDPSKNTDPVTLHDPCNLSRMGGLTDTMRFVLKSAVTNYIEMEPYGEENYCCGGGGGTVGFEEIYDFRMEVGGKKKVEQLKATGAKYAVSPCANCKKQIRELIDYHKLDMEVVGIHDLVAKAIDWEPVMKRLNIDSEKGEKQDSPTMTT
jgi:Fe-S oxidoreductase